MVTLNDNQILEVLCHATVGIAVLDISGEFRFVNNGFAKLHHRPIESFEKYNFMDDPSPSAQQFRAVQIEFQRGLRETYRDDMEVITEDGQRRWYAIETTLVRDAQGRPESTVVINHDITQRKLAEQRALQMANRLAAIENSDAIGLHYFKKGVDVAAPNEALRAMAGISAADADKSLAPVFTPDEWREQDELMLQQLYETGKPVSFLKEIISRKNGTAIPVSVTATLFKDDPEYDGVSLVCDLSDLFNAREEAEEYRRKADLALEASSIGLWDCNLKFEDFKPDERCRKIMGMTGDHPISSEAFSKLLLPQDREKIAAARKRALESDLLSQTVEFRIRKKAGERILCATGRAYRERVTGEIRLVGTLIDITETKMIEHRILESEERFRTLAETIPQIVFTADQNGHVNYVNRKFFEFTGQRPTEGISRELVREAIHPDDVELVRNKWRAAVVDDRAFEFEYRMRTPSSAYRWVIVRVSPLLDRSGKTTRWFGSCTDIDNHCRRNDELSIQRERAQHASQMKSSFLANMSHEIRTPLGAILGFSELLGDGSIPQSERNEYLGIISRNSQSLSRIVDDVLDLSKVEAGLLTLEKIAFSPRTLLSDIVTLFSERARQKNLTLDLRVADNVPQTLLSDPMRIKQIVNNLISNALKFTESGGVSITVSRAGSGSNISIRVEDTGPGISPTRAAALFQPFIQGDDSMTRKYGGTGLGLHLSRKLAEALGGTLRFEQISAHPGSLFEVTIPSIEAAADTTSQWCDRPPIAKESTAKDLEGIRVLVVDDAPDNRTLLERLLIRSGAKVSFAEDGMSAVNQALSTPFDLILMDLQMPGLDGFAATAMIRERGIRLPIVALTAHAIDEVRDRCVTAGFNDFLSKPVNSSELLKSVKSLTAKNAGLSKDPNQAYL